MAEIAEAVAASRLVAFQLRFEIPDTALTIPARLPAAPEQVARALLRGHRLAGTITQVRTQRAPGAAALWVRGVHLHVLDAVLELDAHAALLRTLMEQPATPVQVRNAMAVVRGHLFDLLNSEGGGQP